MKKDKIVVVILSVAKDLNAPYKYLLPTITRALRYAQGDNDVFFLFLRLQGVDWGLIGVDWVDGVDKVDGFLPLQSVISRKKIKSWLSS